MKGLWKAFAKDPGVVVVAVWLGIIVFTVAAIAILGFLDLTGIL